MAQPLPNYIQTPQDAGNLGKRQRLIARHEPFNAMPHDQFFVLQSVQKLQGLYHWGGAATNALVQSKHNGTSSGFFWFQVPTNASIQARLRRMEVAWACTTELDLLAVPRVAVQRFTFTGTASGATVPPAKNKTSQDANVANWRTASTDMTVTLVNNAIVWQFIPPTLGVTSGVGIVFGRSPWPYEWSPRNKEAYVDLAPGEGLVVYQIDDGVASDGRTFSMTARWDEYDRT